MRLTKSAIKALEKCIQAEIEHAKGDGLFPFVQLTPTQANRALDEGLIQVLTCRDTKHGMGFVSGYVLTHKGRMAYRGWAGRRLRMATNHAPLPLSVFVTDAKEPQVLIMDAEGVIAARLFYGRAEVTANLMVTATNAHEELITALQNVADAMITRGINPQYLADPSWNSDVHIAITLSVADARMVFAALEKVKGDNGSQPS